jgi:hypothetical protein
MARDQAPLQTLLSPPVLAAARRSKGYITDGAVVTGVVLVVAAPLLFTNSGFMADFTNHLWLVWSQARSIATTLHPSYFINTTTEGVFNPWFAFYGGSLYGTTGAIAALLGDRPIVAFVGVTMIAIAAAYGGLLWLARQYGLRGWIAHMPALTFVTSAYYITNLYGRGAWPEFIAVSAIPLCIASALHLGRNLQPRTLSFALFVVAIVFFTGSHTLTLIWGSLVLIVFLLMSRLALGTPLVLRGRIWPLLAALGLGVALNAWFLVPDGLYARDTLIAEAAPPFNWNSTSFLNAPGVIFNPFRFVSKESSTPALFVQAPDWFLAWTLITMLLLWRSAADRVLRRFFIGLCGLLAALLVLRTVSSVWRVMPGTLKVIEFPYRLDSYVALTVAGLVMVAAITLDRQNRLQRGSSVSKQLLAALGGVALVSISLCMWQLWVPTTGIPTWTYPDRHAALVSPHVLPRTWYAHHTYADLRSPLVSVSPSRAVILDPNLVRGDRLVQTLTPPPGMTPFSTNILSGPYLASVHGIVRIGRTSDGLVVARRVEPGSGPVRVVVERTNSAAVIVGTVLTVLALVVSLFMLARAARGPLSNLIKSES